MDTVLEREIKGYNIMAWIKVRGLGSSFNYHPRRCLWDVCGKPMIRWVIEALRDSDYINKIAVYTEDEKIARVVTELGASAVPRMMNTVLEEESFDFTSGRFRRVKPRALVHQEKMLNSIFWNDRQACLYHLEKKEGYVPDLLMKTEANFPCVTSRMVKDVVEALFKDKYADASRTYYPSVSNLHSYNYKIKRIVATYTSLVPRQLALPFYHPGPFLLFGAPAKISPEKPGGVATVFIKEIEGIEVHDEDDLLLANAWVAERKKIEKGGKAETKEKERTISEEKGE